MDYKEKYNRLLDAIKDLQKANPSDDGIQNWINDNVHELAESEDEQIIKALADGIRALERCGLSDFGGIPIEDVLDWLEKQKDINSKEYVFRPLAGCNITTAAIQAVEQKKLGNKVVLAFNGAYIPVEGKNADDIIKEYYSWLDDMCKKQGFSNSSNTGKNVKCSADRIVPKFKIGDWVVFANGNVERITNVGTHGYTFDDGDYLLHDNCDKQAHLWSIADAKDGDVLACESGWTCIFKALVNDENFSSYCFMDKTKWFYETGSECHTLKEEFIKAYNGKIYPATKSQRDILMKEMADAGYTFDFDNKKLKRKEKK